MPPDMEKSLQNNNYKEAASKITQYYHKFSTLHKNLNSRLRFEEFIDPEKCKNEKDYSYKAQFLKLGQHIQILDVYKSVDQWQRYMLFRQNREFKNKFWLSNYAAKLDMELFTKISKSRNSAPDLPIPIRATFLIESKWQDLDDQYVRELEIPQIKDLEKLIREDTLAELAYPRMEQKRFFLDLAMREFIHLGSNPEQVSRKKIAMRAKEIKKISRKASEHTPIPFGEMNKYSIEDFINLSSIRSKERDDMLKNMFMGK
jgi:hypothetical protein